MQYLSICFSFVLLGLFLPEQLPILDGPRKAHTIIGTLQATLLIGVTDPFAPLVLAAWKVESCSKQEKW